MATTTPPTTGQTVADASAAAAGLALGRYFANQGASGNVPPQLLQLLDQSVARQNAQNPLFGAVNSGVYQMLPTFARQGAPNFTPQSMPSTYGGGSDSSGLSGTGTAFLAALPAILGLVKHFASNAGGFVGPTQALDPTGFTGPTRAGSATPPWIGTGAPVFGASGPTMGPGSADYGLLSLLNANGIGGMFYGGPGGGGGTGNVGEQSYFGAGGGSPNRGPRSF